MKTHENPILIVRRVDLANQHRIETRQRQGLTAAQMLQTHQAVAGKYRPQGNRIFPTIAKGKGARHHSKFVPITRITTGEPFAPGLAIPQHLQLFCELRTAYTGIRDKFERTRINLRGQRPAITLELAAHGMIEIGDIAHHRQQQHEQHIPDRRAAQTAKKPVTNRGGR